MGLVTSFMGKGFAKAQMLGVVMGTLYNSFVEKDITTFDEFHIAILDIFNTFNSALPGKHYDVPSRQEVQICFESWKTAKDTGTKKQVFINFLKESVTVSKLDDSTLITGLVTPPAAMVVKKVGENVPQLKLIKAVPDVLFVPSATVLALISVKVSRKVFFKKMVKQEPAGP